MTDPLRIVLMRHAKSSWTTDASSDHARPLNGRGRRDAPRIGAELARRGWVPDRVLSSDSARTRETFARMSEALGLEDEAEWRADLYHAGIDELREAAAALPATVKTALFLGHNPGWEDALSWLSGVDHAMKTGSCALLSKTAATWEQALARPGGWTLEAMIHPRDL